MPKKPNFSTFFSVYLRQDVPEKHEGEIQLDCPLLDCENPTAHFFGNCDTGEWHCKRCDESGNARTLITKIHEQYLTQTTVKQWKHLAKLRKGISADIFQTAGFAYDAENDRWLIPYYTYDVEAGEFTPYLNNLGICYPSSNDEPFVIRRAPTLPTYLYNPGLHYYPHETDRAIICEGEWDTLAYYDMCPDTPDLVLGKPGSGFPVSFLKTLTNCDRIDLLLDNDTSGLKQRAKAINTIREHRPKARIFVLDWALIPDATKDVRDYHVANTDARATIEEATIAYADDGKDISIPDEDGEPPEELTAGYVRDAAQFTPILSFQEYVTNLESYLYLNEETKLAMAAVIGITISGEIPGEPVWAFLIGPPSCLDGETVVKINRAGKTFDITLERLHTMFNGLPAYMNKVWDHSIPTAIQRRADDGTVRLVPIIQTIKSGKKACYEVTTQAGNKVTASADHKFLTQRGWVRLKNLYLDDFLYINAGKIGAESSGRSRRESYVYGLCNHPYRRQPCKGNRSKGRGKDRVLRHRLVYEAYMNDMTFQEYISFLRDKNIKRNNLKYLAPEQIIHHKDGNHSNNELSNLELTTLPGHGVIHGQDNAYNVGEKTVLSKIVSIEPVGTRETYDITVADNPHNFLANGIVVHNSGKTQFIESFGGSNQWFDNLSKITAESFVSGWRDDSGEEPSYLPSLKNKTLFVKDFTTTLMGPTEAQHKVFGLLTDIYDGHVKIHFGNNQMREFHDTYFNMVAGVTDIVHNHSAATIGERFLRIDWLGKNYDRREYTRRALQNFGKTANRKNQLTAWTLGFVKHLREQTVDTEIPPHYLNAIVDLAEFIAIVRTKVVSDRFEGMVYKPRPELGPRLGLTLAKLFVACRLVTGSSEAAFKVVHKVAFDTCYGFALDIVRYILANPWAPRQTIAQGTNIHDQRAFRVLNDLCATGVLLKRSSPKGSGRPPNYFELNPSLLPALRNDIDENRPANKRQRPTGPNNNPRTGKPSPSKRRN